MIEAVLELPFKLALSVAVWLLVTLAAVAVKVAELDPLATTTDEGTVRLESLLLSATADPPLGAPPLRLTVQVVLFGVVIDEALQANELTINTELIEPPATLVSIAAPEGDAATALVNPMLIELEPDGVMLRVATTPLPMTEAFSPAAIHTKVPELCLQYNVLPADVRAVPALTENADTDNEG